MEQRFARYACECDADIQSSRSTRDPETLYKRRWALNLLERVIAALQPSAAESGRAVDFDVLKASLLGEGPPAAMRRRPSGWNERSAVKTAVHRLLGSVPGPLRAAIAETVSDPAEVDEELKYLERALRQ
jgi:RNA polymerase sigma-70 factor (ECF subfamily)